MRIMFVGDINLGEYYTAFGHGPRSYLEHSEIFSGVRDILKQADIVAGNLEAPITDHRYRPKVVESAVLRGSPRHAHQLAEAGFKVLQLANNHSVQHGPEGFSETVSVIEKLGISAVGMQSQDVKKLTHKNQTLGFLAASDVPDNTDADQQCYQRLDEEFISRVENSVKTVDHLFVMLHWGLESSTEPLPYQRRMIEDLASLGVRAIIGAHPHLFYEVWRERNDTIAAPSLGNFVFDLFWDVRLLKSGILDIELNPDGIASAKVWPVTIDPNSGRPVSSIPPLPLNESLTLYDLGEHMHGGQIRKLKRFFLDYRKGHRALKRQFIIKKVRRAI